MPKENHNPQAGGMEFHVGCMCERLLLHGADREFLLMNIYGNDYIPTKIRHAVVEFAVLINTFPEEGEIVTQNVQRETDQDHEINHVKKKCRFSVQEHHEREQPDTDRLAEIEARNTRQVGGASKLQCSRNRSRLSAASKCSSGT